MDRFAAFGNSKAGTLYVATPLQTQPGHFLKNQTDFFEGTQNHLEMYCLEGLTAAFDRRCFSGLQQILNQGRKRPFNCLLISFQT